MPTDNDIEITTYRHELQSAFVRLNTEWISTYFHLEEHDRRTFADIEGSILRDGGEILFALRAGVAVGCCALIHHAADNPLGRWELAKMAVTASERGHGVGSKLMAALLQTARQRKADSVYLEGNTRLRASIAMYRKFGFREEELGKQSYERVDIIMRWNNDSAATTPHSDTPSQQA